MKHKFLFLINPFSGTRDKHALAEIIRSRCAEESVEFLIHETDPEGFYSDVKELINDEQFTRVVICGGDGTVNQAVGALRNLQPEFAIIPMGSGNGLAFAAGISKNIQKALKVAFSGVAIETDAFLLNDHFGCMLCGTGFDATIAHDFAKRKKRGLLTYLKRSFIHFFSARAHPFAVETRQGILETEAWFISIANSNQFGNHVTIAPRASLNDGLLDIVIVKKMNRVRMLYEIAWQIKMGKVDPAEGHGKCRNILYFQSPYIRIHNKARARVHIDGEPMPAFEHITIEIIPRAFKLVQPNG